MIASFGPRATRYAERLRASGQGDLDAVITDVETLLTAHGELMTRRYDGRSTYGMILPDEPRWRAVMEYTPALLQNNSDYDVRCMALSRLSGGTMPLADGATSSSLWSEPFDDSVRVIVAEFCLLADAMLVRSYAEYQRLLPLMKRPRTVDPIVAEPVLPAVERRLSPTAGVIIWAPNRTPAEIAFHAFGLHEFHGAVTCVTGPGPIPPQLSKSRFVHPSDPALPELLATASCVVCPEPEDPADAVAFARRGYGVVAPLTSGAYEFVRDVVSLTCESLREVYIAVMIASAQPASVRAFAAPAATPPRTPLPPIAGELPLVTIITPTFNRREDLPISLNSMARQTYKNIEAIVINDGGERVDDIVARYPFARLINQTVNEGSHNQAVRGLAAMKGEYVCFLADDDVFMPDHIERMVGAILRAGTPIAHGNAMIHFQAMGKDGKLVTIGSNMSIFNDSATETEALVSTPIAGQALVFRRDGWDAFGGIRADSILADQEMQLRAATMFNIAYVDAVTCDWGVRGDRNISTKIDSVPELLRLYNEIYPLPDRPIVRQLRDRIITIVQGREKGKFAFPPTITRSPDL